MKNSTAKDVAPGLMTHYPNTLIPAHISQISKYARCK